MDLGIVDQEACENITKPLRFLYEKRIQELSRGESIEKFFEECDPWGQGFLKRWGLLGLAQPTDIRKKPNPTSLGQLAKGDKRS